MLIPGNVPIADWRCLVGDRKGNHGAIREDWAWLSSCGRIEPLPAENELHALPQPAMCHGSSLRGGFRGFPCIPNFHFGTKLWTNFSISAEGKRHLWPLPTTKRGSGHDL